MNAAQAIARSISHTEIVTIEWTAALESALSIESDDSAVANDTLEFWGCDEDGGEWRVHLSDVAGGRAAATEEARDMTTQYYEIQAQVLGQWTTDVIGDGNRFDSEDEAQAALDGLLETNPSWAIGEDEEARGYRVRLVDVA